VNGLIWLESAYAKGRPEEAQGVTRHRKVKNITWYNSMDRKEGKGIAITIRKKS